MEDHPESGFWNIAATAVLVRIHKLRQALAATEQVREKDEVQPDDEKVKHL